MNYMIYCKHTDEKSYGAMNLSEGKVGVGLVYATLIPDLNKAKGYVDKLAEGNPDFSFQVREAGKSKVVYQRKAVVLEPMETLAS